MRYSRFVPVTVLAVLVSALVGGLFGSNVAARQDEVTQQYRVFTSALAAIDREYVDEVPSDRLVYSAIDGMLKTLDPHSSFFDPKSYAQMRERQEGKYYGLGIQISVIDGDITVMSIFEGSPAYKKGLRRGDVIARIAGAEAKGWTSEQAVAKLKGPKGTTVNISLRRRGYDGLIDLDVERDEVNIVTVRGAFMVDKDTGYIKLGDFSETSDDEVGAALKKLTDSGMKRLVFDLRDNPGGPLDQAIKIANRFLPKGDMIVYTRGRIPKSDEDYRAQEDSQYTHLPMVVLVNRNSASASEIVTGSLQDHDRALVVGETTFGKALVQSVYKISGNAGLALTTGPLLHAERPDDSAPVGRHLRRVPHLLAARSEPPAGALGSTAQEDRRGPRRLQRRRHRSRQVHGRLGRRIQPVAVRPHARRPRRLRELRRSVHGRRRYASQRGEQEQEAASRRGSSSPTR